METLFWYKKGKERPQERSPNVAGGGRTNVPSADSIGGICRVPTMDVERYWGPDSVRPAPQKDPKHSLLMQPKCQQLNQKGPRLEDIPNEKCFIKEQRLNFI
jgi:hypothetical protein